mmetsp:Transcript_126047/g.362563  ORF Transcript_126047/g.362563 Transcript_126047/m.362563 type:complete len:545 (-) Transcript_126047:230-1864(-)
MAWFGGDASQSGATSQSGASGKSAQAKAAAGKAKAKAKAKAPGAKSTAVVVAPVAVGPRPNSSSFQVTKKSRPEQGGFRAELASAAASRKQLRLADQPGSPKSPVSDASTVGELKVHYLDRLPFNVTVVCVTFFNIAVIAMEMDMGPGPGASLADRFHWWALEGCITCFFFIELTCRILRGRKAWFLDIWNTLDFILVCLAILDFLILSPAGMGGQIRLFTVFRAFRGIRLVRLVRMFGSVRELWFLVGGITNSVKAVGWVACVVLLLLYVCAVAVTSEIGQNDDAYSIGPSYDGEVWPYKDYFGTVFKSMFTLLQVMTLDSWCDNIVRHVIYRQPLMGVFFVGFIFVMAFGLMNVLVGVIVENTLQAAAISDARIAATKGEARKEAVEKLYDVLTKSDQDGSGEISMDEFAAAYQSKIVQRQLDLIGLTFDEVQEIFRLLDYEDRGMVELIRFRDSCRELTSGAKRRDLVQVEVTVGALAQHLERLDNQFARIEGDIGDLTRMADSFVQNTVRVLTGFDGSVKVPPRPGSPSGAPPPDSQALR